MPRTLKTLAVLLIALLLPLRAVAAVTIGYCPAGHQDMALAASDGHGQIAVSHSHHGTEHQPVKPATPTCGVCVEHCSSAAFAPSASPVLGAPAIAHLDIYLAERSAPAFFPDQLDRPPLA